MSASGVSPLGRLLGSLSPTTKSAVARVVTRRLPWLVPAPVVRVLALLTARGVRLTRRPVVEVVRANLAVVLGEHVDRSPRLERAVTESLRAYYEHWFSFLRMPALGAAGVRDAVVLTGVEHVAAAHAAGRGTMIVCAHMGRYEWGSAALSTAVREITGAPLTGVARTMGSEVTQEILTTLRRAGGNGEVVWIDPTGADGRVRLAATLVRRLRAAGAVGVMIDRFAVGPTVEVSMFGRPVALAASPVTLAARTGAALLPCACWVERGRVHFRVHPEVSVPAVMRGGEPSSGLTEEERCRIALETVAGVFEKEIAEHPAAWHATSTVFR